MFNHCEDSFIPSLLITPLFANILYQDFAIQANSKHINYNKLFRETAIRVVISKIITYLARASVYRIVSTRKSLWGELPEDKKNKSTWENLNQLKDATDNTNHQNTYLHKKTRAAKRELPCNRRSSRRDDRGHQGQHHGQTQKERPGEFNMDISEFCCCGHPFRIGYILGHDYVYKSIFRENFVLYLVRQLLEKLHKKKAKLEGYLLPQSILSRNMCNILL